MLGPLLDTGDAETEPWPPGAHRGVGKQTPAQLVFTPVTSVVSVVFRARWTDWGWGRYESAAKKELSKGGFAWLEEGWPAGCGEQKQVT